MVMRRLIVESLSKQSEIEVVGQASNGRQALEKVRELNPDLITMDVEMPEMSGIETLQELKKFAPKLPVIMFSALTRQGATTVLEALLAGAKDYATKPADVSNLSDAVQAIELELVPKILALCSKKIPTRTRKEAFGSPSLGRDRFPSGPGQSREASLPVPTNASGAVTFKSPIEVLCVGSSTGGPNALSDFFKGIPATFPVPIVIVQHMPVMFTRILAERLTSESAIKTFEGEEGMIVRPGEAYVAPGGKHMEVVRRGNETVLTLHEGPQENSCRPAVDVLFRSVVKAYGMSTFGVIMTGMGRDGCSGCELIRQAGGKVLIQDQETSVVWGMPGAVFEAGLADRVVPLAELSPTACRWVAESRKGRG